ncbi:MAG: hypothetical protein WC421_07400 [Elusimicrobiales bacterium]
MFQELLAKIAAELDARGIPYMVIGGQAVLLYGEPRLTKDIDITLGLDADGAGPVAECAARIGLKSLAGDAAEFAKSTMIFPAQDTATGIRVDFIFSWTPYERQAIARARSVELCGTKVKFASLEDVIVHKIIAGRPKDLEDARIVALKNPGFDGEYISRWLADFEAALGRTFDKSWKPE